MSLPPPLLPPSKGLLVVGCRGVACAASGAAFSRSCRQSVVASAVGLGRMCALAVVSPAELMFGASVGCLPI